MPACREDRFHQEPTSAEDTRLPFQRDRDRILYTTAFQRLAQVTQTIGPDEGHVFHNRLTHSLKVAQVARRIAERLQRMQPRQAEKVGLDPDAAEAVGRFVSAISLQESTENSSGRLVTIDEDAKKQVVMLKQLTWIYVILNERLKTQQHGQRKLIRDLFKIHLEAANKREFDLFPAPFKEELLASRANARAVADYIASMTEKEALGLYHRLTAITPGSALH